VPPASYFLPLPSHTLAISPARRRPCNGPRSNLQGEINNNRSQTGTRALSFRLCPNRFVPFRPHTLRSYSGSMTVRRAGPVLILAGLPRSRTKSCPALRRPHASTFRLRVSCCFPDTEHSFVQFCAPSGHRKRSSSLPIFGNSYTAEGSMIFFAAYGNQKPERGPKHGSSRARSRRRWRIRRVAESMSGAGWGCPHRRLAVIALEYAGRRSLALVLAGIGVAGGGASHEERSVLRVGWYADGQPRCGTRFSFEKLAFACHTALPGWVLFFTARV
jgi:hypothetical protein